MEMEYSQLKIFIIPVAAGKTLKQSDFAVHNLQFACTDTMLVPVEYKQFPYH
jgi:hypothetical protein